MTICYDVTICYERLPRVLLGTVVPSALTSRRWGGLGAADACQRADGQRGLCPRQRSNICCSLSHLGSFASIALSTSSRSLSTGASQGLATNHCQMAAALGFVTGLVFAAIIKIAIAMS